MGLALNLKKEMKKNQESLGLQLHNIQLLKPLSFLPLFFPMGLQKGMDKEFFLLFTVFDENMSWYSNANQAAGMLDSRLLSEDVEGFQDSNQMHGMGNSFAFVYNFRILRKM